MKYLLFGQYLIYKVKKEDTLSYLAIKFNTTVENICQDNGLKEDLYIGQTLFIKISNSNFFTVKPFQSPYPFARIPNYEHNLY